MSKTGRRSFIDSILEYYDRLELVQFLLFKTVVFIAGVVFILEVGYRELRPAIDVLWNLLRAP